ncbi:hypothetical protein A3H80_02085 [Candidatus Roizmanbacteria bacterium RIFCSPLOWO2_02_FULL_37_19]|uniref:Uncharacterized protein n=1 Tax=Candidatus Roizmanbacteria bacterium RIFCSPHIGHO2_02_FULL_37_24 TaxID=1802037 RepID=A0A1F7H0S0_9BACT|nr:MAG: hypothetical protein A2862_02670 [Candidatus Roizmanbacteria bacterium RIFCSPHIGHO2_01_FULL_38_41]OGK24524.1 MAG: hypothetical protein A3C24_03165 [Candidatus Roizmanbacteria bacterium RIFCSPHIGHO2_02_FULL_37_24]OGK31978.1 MAG: hypothetical protein A3E10_04505 [Candidatus Roizmanbacteria bacterium RIFCSPHIGHO2_12_FULL_37_23]OGK43779.1 MAG: hypothetical protein A2956_04630 [Candidatus Roizmanbacteria bacterium RIFCSPLOWO2_01_FULL_37_57]OGK54333.1 MAG: hypothetical protein A3H80_02085 [Ca
MSSSFGLFSEIVNINVTAPVTQDLTSNPTSGVGFEVRFGNSQNFLIYDTEIQFYRSNIFSIIDLYFSFVWINT